MNGAEAILRTLADNGVEVCFANPGTSEMQIVAVVLIASRACDPFCVSSRASRPARPTAMRG